jgi:hypothetical protein
MMIKKFRNFNESIDKTLLYYAFDFDDNILYMPTKIHMEELIDGEWVHKAVSTSQFAVVRKDRDRWRILHNAPSEAFSEFRDVGPRGRDAFIDDVKEALRENKYAPSWDDFIECLVNGSIFAIITARGHEDSVIREAIEWIIDNELSEDQVYEMYNNLLKFSYIFGDEDDNDRILRGQPSKNSLVSKYLDNCDYVGVSAPSRGGDPQNVELAKEEALLEFKRKINNFARSVGYKASIGFSDDDIGNYKHISELVDKITNEQFPYITKYVVKYTKDPDNIDKKIRLNETSNQAPGMESSVMPFTQFNNMTNRLYPSGANRQDDFFNQIRRQGDYLAKTSEELFKDENKIKRTRKKKKVRKISKSRHVKKI